jgi:hypothetical protein
LRAKKKFLIEPFADIAILCLVSAALLARRAWCG